MALILGLEFWLKFLGRSLFKCCSYQFCPLGGSTEAGSVLHLPWGKFASPSGSTSSSWLQLREQEASKREGRWKKRVCFSGKNEKRYVTYHWVRNPSWVVVITHRAGLLLYTNIKESGWRWDLLSTFNVQIKNRKTHANQNCFWWGQVRIRWEACSTRGQFCKV